MSLLDELESESKSVAVTDRGKRVAVIMGYKHFRALVDMICASAESQPDPLEGLIVSLGDLDQTHIDSLFAESIQNTSEKI